MTRPGKCDVCRARKVKCDQGRPRCEACAKGKRLCTYNFADSFDANKHTGRTSGRSDDTTSNLPTEKCLRSETEGDGSSLVLRSLRPAEQGDGVFATLTSGKRPSGLLSKYSSPSPSAGPFDAASQLRARLLVLIGYLRDQSRRGILYEPSEAELRFDEEFAQTGVNQLKDEATSYMLDSYHAFLVPTLETQSIARQGGLTVSKSLRLALANGTDYKDNELLYVIGMLELSESLHGWQSWRQQYHSLAMARLLKMRWRSRSWTDLDEIFARCCYLEEVQEAIVAGTYSDFDDPSRLACRKHLTLSSPYDRAMMCVMDNIVCAPRLVCLLREALASSNNQRAFDLALTLAQQMYHDERRWQVEETLQKVISTRAQSDNRAGSSERLPEFKFVYLSEHYHMWRVLVCGAILRLHDIRPQAVSSVFDITRIQAEDLAHGKAILDIADEALIEVAGVPLMALTLIIPMIVSYSCWKRLERRAHSRVDQSSRKAALTHARGMKALCVDHVSSVMDRWKTAEWQLDEMVERLSDAFAGGPTLTWLSRRGKSIDGVADSSARVDRPTVY